MILKIKCRPFFHEAFHNKDRQFFIINDVEDIETGCSKEFLMSRLDLKQVVSLPILSEDFLEHFTGFYLNDNQLLFTYYYKGDDKFDYSKEYIFYIIYSYSIFKNPFIVDWN